MLGGGRPKKKKSRKGSRRSRRRRQEPVVDVDEEAEAGLDAPLLRNGDEDRGGNGSRDEDTTSSDSWIDPFFVLD